MDIIFDDYFKNGAFMSSIFGNIYYSKNIKFKIDDNIEYLNIITNEMRYIKTRHDKVHGLQPGP